MLAGGTEVLFSDPEIVFKGILVFLAPHMDDEVLACGGTIARLRDKERVHIVYATDGSKSPVPTLRCNSQPSRDLPEIRRAEAEAALSVLGVPKENMNFLGYPDGRLSRHLPTLVPSVTELVKRLCPDHLFIPFRYDRHPDHLALHEAVKSILPNLDRSVQIVEYFVYHRWRLLPGGDMRRLVHPEHLTQIDIRQQRKQKRSALECYRSQTTVYFDWQRRPILPPQRLNEVSHTPELFLVCNPYRSGTEVFSCLRKWIPLVHWLEPRLKRKKDWLESMLQDLRRSSDSDL